MQNNLTKLKKAVDGLEGALIQSSKSSIDTYIEEIEKLCKVIKNQSDFETVKLAPVAEKHRLITEIEFLYKPVTMKNVYAGNYLERFAEERTNDLKYSKAINQHNEFWKQHETIAGNVYGSVPMELINADSANYLARSGWLTVSVDVLEVDFDCEDKRACVEYCETYFNKYIIVNELETNSILVLKYNI